MAIQDDFSVAANGDIRYTGSSANYTVIALHRWLGDLMDDAAASGNDILDITDATASERATDNLITLNAPYNIDDTAAQHLYDGSIVQDGGNTIYDGVVVIANAGMRLEIIQNGALISPNFWTTGLNADAANGISHRFMVKVRTGGSDTDGRRLIGLTREFGFSYSEFKINGTARGNNVMALTYVTDLNNQTAEGTVSGWSTITNTEGYRSIDVNGDTTPENYYSEWNKASFTINQLYERIKWLSRRGTGSTVYGLSGVLFRGITHEVNLTGGSGTWNAVEAVSWGSGGTAGTGQMLAVNNTTATSATKMWIQLISGVAPSGSVTITGGGSGATNTNSGTPTERTIQFGGSAPITSTGSSLIGNYGLGVESADLSASDILFDLTNTQRNPPNNVSFTVNGLVASEDRVLVTRLGYTFAFSGQTSNFADGATITFSGGGTAKLLEQTDLGATGYYTVRMLTGAVPAAAETMSGSGDGTVASTPVPTIDVEQYTNAALLNGASVTSIVVNETIDSDTPATGTIRILRNSGIRTVHTYSSWATSTFTIASADFSTDNAASGNGVFSTFIDKVAAATGESFTVVFNTTRNLFVRVRDGGGSPIKTFETTGTLTSAGGSTTAIRTTDT